MPLAFGASTRNNLPTSLSGANAGTHRQNHQTDGISPFRLSHGANGLNLSRTLARPSTEKNFARMYDSRRSQMRVARSAWKLSAGNRASETPSAHRSRKPGCQSRRAKKDSRPTALGKCPIWSAQIARQETLDMNSNPKIASSGAKREPRLESSRIGTSVNFPR